MPHEISLRDKSWRSFHASKNTTTCLGQRPFSRGPLSLPGVSLSWGSLAPGNLSLYGAFLSLGVYLSLRGLYRISQPSNGGLITYSQFQNHYFFYRNVQRFRGGSVLKIHRLGVSLNSGVRVMKKKKITSSVQPNLDSSLLGLQHKVSVHLRLDVFSDAPQLVSDRGLSLLGLCLSHGSLFLGDLSLSWGSLSLIRVFFSRRTVSF